MRWSTSSVISKARQRHRDCLEDYASLKVLPVNLISPIAEIGKMRVGFLRAPVSHCQEFADARAFSAAEQRSDPLSPFFRTWPLGQILVAGSLDGIVRLTFLARGFPSTDEFMQRQQTQHSTPPWRRCAKLALCFGK